MTVLEPFAWWHIPAAVSMERELFDVAPWSEAQFWSELAAGDRAWFAAVDDDALVGYAGIAIAAGEAEVMTIAVRASHQGRGLGRALLQALLDAADAANARRVMLEVETGNVAAIALYERNGFVRTGVRPNYYALGVDALLMERRHG